MMPKKIKFESFKYRFLTAAQGERFLPTVAEQPQWLDFIQYLAFSYEKSLVTIKWILAEVPSAVTFTVDDARFYVRGDDPLHVTSDQEMSILGAKDIIKQENEVYFKQAVLLTAKTAGYQVGRDLSAIGEKRLTAEREFHDAWAESEDVENINVRAANEACTSPEMRYITKKIGDIRGKRLLDVGCGLGEASVYFALLGATVTASDLSQGMLDATCRLASANGVSVIPHLASAEDMQLSSDALYDIIYAGNLLHHVDIDKTLARIKPHLAPGGSFVTWDPLAYNPIINVYRAIATDVRTSDEHPLKLHDIKLFKKHFRTVETQYYWLTTLLIFIIMALVQRRNPNQERFWKVVVREEHKWRWLYQPLEKLDRLFLSFFPPLRLLCWNVVVICKS